MRCNFNGFLVRAFPGDKGFPANRAFTVACAEFTGFLCSMVHNGYSLETPRLDDIE
jgi:hypothetical protein